MQWGVLLSLVTRSGQRGRCVPLCRAGGLATLGCSLESVSSGPVLRQDLCRDIAHPRLTPPMRATEDCVAKQQRLRELVLRKKWVIAPSGCPYLTEALVVARNGLFHCP